MPASPEMTLPELSQFATELEDPMLVDNVFPEQPPFDFLHIIVQKHKVERIQFQNNLSKSIPFCVSPFSHLFLPPPFFSATRKDTVPALYNKLNTYRFIQVSY